MPRVLRVESVMPIAYLPVEFIRSRLQRPNVLSRSKQPIPRQVGDPMRSAHAYLDEGGIARAKPKPLYAFCGNLPPQVLERVVVALAPAPRRFSKSR